MNAVSLKSEKKVGRLITFSGISLLNISDSFTQGTVSLRTGDSRKERRVPLSGAYPEHFPTMSAKLYSLSLLLYVTLHYENPVLQQIQTIPK